MAMKTLLVANRGEIALRIMRTAKTLGLRTVAVYSDADADAPHVRFADLAVRIGPAQVDASYLNQIAILDAARQSASDAIHPGYGFLSENSAFAEAVETAGLIFVGPTSAAIRIMGDKARAKRAMIEAGVPCLPGYEGEDQADAALISAAQEIGAPVMVKASAGGGGRGMRLVEDLDALPEALALARSEAAKAFGSGDLILERAVQRPRHVEIQVFGDAHGQIIHLGERDCSVQRRHQKVLEEAPCPVMTDALRVAMGEAAVRAARAVDYQGAGTVEFLLDEGGDFYFLEMNTRLQVEHPVTELVTGLDLVALQLRVAQGLELGLTQNDLSIKGHAIEARLYAEDPSNDFLPSTGRVLKWTPPCGQGVRVDAGIAEGGEVTPFYDAMVAKVIGHGPDRDTARRNLVAALERTVLFGPITNRTFLIDALEREAFVSGDFSTAFLKAEFDDGIASPEPDDETLAIAALIQHLVARDGARAAALDLSPEILDWSSSAPRSSSGAYRVGDHITNATVTALGGNAYRVKVGETEFEIGLSDRTADSLSISVDGTPKPNVAFKCEGDADVYVQRGASAFHLTNTAALLSSQGEAAASGRVIAPMHGSLIELRVADGDIVSAGDLVAVFEAMKMHHQIHAPIGGIVADVSASVGQQMAADDPILRIDETGG
ncbi:MAG: acetyl-CoA carboxylase biotin carboxylase subunit [Pseudomonadota bacterium]